MCTFLHFDQINAGFMSIKYLFKNIKNRNVSKRLTVTVYM